MFPRLRKILHRMNGRRSLRRHDESPNDDDLFKTAITQPLGYDDSRTCPNAVFYVLSIAKSDRAHDGFDLHKTYVYSVEYPVVLLLLNRQRLTFTTVFRPYTTLDP